MKAHFNFFGLHQPVVVVRPDGSDEEILLAAFIRYDANVFTILIDRYENGRIEKIAFLAGTSR